MQLEIGKAAGAALVALLSLFAFFFLYLMIGVNHLETGDSPERETISSCMEKYKSPTLQVNDLYGLSNICFGKIASQFKLDEEKILRDSYVFQRNENVVLLYMVVLVTLSGVALAGVQLLASYSLAAGARDKPSENSELKDKLSESELKYSAQGVSFRSSVIGLMILAMSFAFFLVFIIYVYTFQPEQSARPSAGTARLNLLPAPPTAKKVQPAPSATAGPEPTPSP